MKSSKKLYDAVAEILFRGTYVSFAYKDGTDLLDKDYVVSSLADLFAADNPRFIKDKFIKACYSGKGKK